MSAGPNRATDVGLAGRTGLLAAVTVVAVVSAFAGRFSAVALGAGAGLAFGLVGMSARVLHHPDSVRGLLLDPAAYALAEAGVLGNLFYVSALQRGRVTTATAATVAVETVVPASMGLVFLGDRPAHGYGWAAATGFVLAVCGALSLARHGRVAAPQEPPLSLGVANAEAVDLDRLA